MNKGLKNILISAAILGGTSFIGNSAIAETPDPITSYDQLKEALRQETSNIEVNIQGEILNNATKATQLKLQNKSVTINGLNYVDEPTGQTIQSSIISDGNDHLGVDVQANAELNLNNVSLENFKNNGWAGVVYNEGKLTINNANFLNNECSNGSIVGGGAIANYYNGIANISGNVSFIGNSATNFYGGAIFNGANMNISTTDTEKVLFENNSTSRSGGAIYNEGNLYITGNSEFLNNTASSSAGVLANEKNADATISGMHIFENNSATDYYGGAIYNSAKLAISGDVNYIRNKAVNQSGGAIYNAGDLNLTGNQTFSQNSGKLSGGAIANVGEGDIDIVGNFIFDSNFTTYNHGGAIFNAANMSISTNSAEKITFSNNTAGQLGGAIYNHGTLSLFGNYEFLNNSANKGGAIYNDGLMSIEGNYSFEGNHSNSYGGAIMNEKGNLSIIGARGTSTNTPIESSTDASISFDGNSVYFDGIGDGRGGAIYVTGTQDNPAFLTINNIDFKNNYTSSHGGAIFIEQYVDFNIENSKFIGNQVIGSTKYENRGWGGAIGLGSEGGSVNGYIHNTLFDSNYSNNSGGALPSGSALTIVNSSFLNNHARLSAGAISYNPKYALENKFLKIIADGGDTIFSGNWVGDTTLRTVKNAEGLYIGNAIIGSDGESITGEDGNDSNIYFNAGNSGKIIFNDIINATGNSYDDKKEKDGNLRPKKNNPNIQLNQKDVSYSKYNPDVATGNINYAPSDGTIIFNNTVQGANLVLHNGTLAFGQANAYAAQPANERPDHYFSDGAKITLKGGTLDLINNVIEEGSIFNPDSVSVVNDANLRIDLGLFGNGSELDGKIDYIDSTISGNGTLSIDKITFEEDASAKDIEVGKSTVLRFVDKNTANTILNDSLKTIITSNAGYTLNGEISGADSTTTDSLKVTKTINAGGLPVAVSLGGTNNRTYIYNATDDEEITGYIPDSSNSNDNAWGKKFSVWDGTTTNEYTASNILQGEMLTINGNGKNIIASQNADVIGIELGKTGSSQQTLTINDVKKSDNTGGWSNFNSAIINKGGIVNLNNSIFSNNKASDVTFTRKVGGTSETKLGNGGAVYNEAGTLNIANTDFTNNSASRDGGAIYNAANAIVNIKATDDRTVTFDGNTAAGNKNDIYNEGILNIASVENSSIIFNGGISGNSANFGTINIGNDISRGNVIFNNTVANQNVILDYGTLQFGANATVARDDYFDNVNLTLNGGTFDAQNGLLDTIKVKDLTIGDISPELKLDVSLAGSSSDKIEVSGDLKNLSADSTLWIGPISITQAFAEGQTSSVIEFINKEVNSSIENVNKTITVDGVSYSVSVNSNTLTIMKEGESGGFAYEVINTNKADRTFQIGSNDEIVSTWIGGNNKLAGMRFQIHGGSKQKSLIANGIKGIVVGEYNGNPQQLDINDVTSYQGFDSAVINNGGKVNIFSTKFEQNHATENGSVIQNNNGTVTINGGSEFSNNKADGKGGAIYNSQDGILNLVATSEKIITFKDNKAVAGNDIYNEGEINISGSGKVLIGSGIAGTSTGSITNTSGNLELGGDNSGYLGSYIQQASEGSSAPTLTVKQGATFFGGTSSINAGTLNWNTENDIADGAKLTIDNAALVVGENGLLTIKGDSSIDNASSVTSDGNLILAKDMIVKTIDGNGTLTANGASLTFNSSSVLADTLNFVSNNAIANIKNLASADSIINKIASGNNNQLTINVNGSNTNSNIEVDGTNIANLNFSGGGQYGGEITGSGTVSNNGDLVIKGKQSGFNGTFKQISGSTTFDTSSYLFAGIKDIQSGKLNINAGTIDYNNILLGNNVELNQTNTDTALVGLDSSKVSFNGTGANINVNGGNVNLSKIDNGSKNNISFVDSSVKLADKNYTGSTIYNFKNSEIDLIETDGTTKDYEFDNIKTDNTKLSLNVKINRNDNGNTITTDTIAINNSDDGNQIFKLGNIHISGEENGQRGTYNTTSDTIQGWGLFDENSSVEKIVGATTSWTYDITQTSDNKSIQMTIKDYANAGTLDDMNKLSGKRFFQFSEKEGGNEYHIENSLSDMAKGEFLVTGNDIEKDILSGVTTSGKKGSFFNIVGDEKTDFTLNDVTVKDAEKIGNGSVVSNTNKNATINITNAIIKGNTSTGDGGAIYNGVDKVNAEGNSETNLVISNTIFDGNLSGTGKGGAIYNAGAMTVTNSEFKTSTDTIYLTDTSNTLFNETNIINSSISGEEDAAIWNEGVLNLNGDNSNYLGKFNQSESFAKTNVNGTFFNGYTSIENGELNWLTNNSTSGILRISGGKLSIGNDTVNAKLTLSGQDSLIDEAAIVYIDGNSDLELADNSTTNLNDNDIWVGKITLDGGKLNLNKITNYEGAKLDAQNGDLNINVGTLIVGNESTIKDTVNTTISNNANLQINNGGNVSLKDNSNWSGSITLNGGNLTVNDLTSNGVIKAGSGNLTVNSGKLTVGENSVIASAVKTIVSTGVTLDITNGGYVHLGTDDVLGGEVLLNGGTLDYAMVTRSGEANVIKANTGNLNLLKDSVLTIKDPSVIKKEVDVDIQKGATVNLKNGSELNLDAKDKWNGLITSETNGVLKTDNVDNSKSGGQLQQNRGTSIFDNKSNILIDGKDSYIVGGTTSILGNSALHLGSGVDHFTLDNLNMSGKSLLNTMNNTVNKYGTLDNMNVNGTDNVSIDVSPRDWKGDTFVINNLNGTNNGTLNISDFNFVGLAPVDRHIKIQVFDAQNINDVNFTAGDKKIFTPIGNYQMFSQGGGAYTASLVDYNPQVYRGQVATLAAYNHQLLVDDMLTNHFILPNERLIDKAAQANKTSSVSPLFAPYQSTIEDGGIWTKTYVSFEQLSMTNNLKVGNNVYGTLVGADFPAIKMKKGWKFIPTAFIGYNGGMQGFNNVDMYQNGGQGGFMGTFIKNNFIGSVTAYGGGYFNEMNVAGNTDRTGNWFAGTAAKAAYNLHATKHFIIQPTAFVSYNIFGKQSWGTDYGSMSMNSGTLNGINVAPGMNLIYSRDTWSVYGTIQYMFNINAQVGGKAGNVNLPKTEMRHGYINYGIGATKTWKDRLTSYFQINFRNGGRTGVGFQLGLNYFFDWGKSKKKTSQATDIKPVKKVIKSL